MPNIIEADALVSAEFDKVIPFPSGVIVHSIEIDEDDTPLVRCRFSYDYEPFESLSAPEFEFDADEVVVSKQFEYTINRGVTYISAPGTRSRPSRKKV